MQQTEKYQLNLIETSDPFSPAALNENMEKVEAALGTVQSAAHEDAAALNDALAARVLELEYHRVLVGTYTGNGPYGTTQDIILGVTPVLLMLYSIHNGLQCLVEGRRITYGSDLVATLIENGFRVVHHTYLTWNDPDVTYYFIAFV